MHVLATFLGSGANRQYRPAQYAFSRDKLVRDKPLFSWALLEYLHNAGRPADTFVVFGTPTSFWEHLLRVACPERSEEIDSLATLAQRGISRRELAPYREAILEAARAYGVRQVKLELIDFLEKNEEQLRFIGQLAALLEPDDKLTLDITHGLRHQPILCRLAAMVLRAAWHATIEDIYYGALELTPKIEGAETPILRLNPLLALADWIAALAESEATGDYGVVATLLRRDGVGEKTCSALEEGFFFHSIGNFDLADAKFSEWEKGIGNTALHGASSLFTEEINRRIAFVIGSRNKQDQLIAGARDCLERGSLVRAAEMGFEATIAALTQHGLVNAAGETDPYTTTFKAWVGNRPWKNVRDLPQAVWNQAFLRLRGMRNRMAHLDYDTPAPQRVAQALQSRTAAEAALREDFDVLFGLEPEALQL
jgi:CRISPR-associated Csx2 family protein